jgi:hypothetical protein
VEKNSRPPLFNALKVAGDNIINLAETTAAVAPSISGVVSNAEDDCSVEVTLPAAGSLPSRNLRTSLFGGAWSVAIPADLLEAYAASNGTYSASVSITNRAGNRASSPLDFVVDTQAPAITLNSVAASAWESAALDPDHNPSAWVARSATCSPWAPLRPLRRPLRRPLPGSR